MSNEPLKSYRVPKPEDTIDTLNEEQLLALRHQIDLKLNIQIKDVNLTEELGLQYRQGKILLETIQDDKGTPANQKAQVFNAVASMLEKIVKLQESVYSMERLKRYEAAFLKSLETLPEAGKTAFFDLYGGFLKDTGV